MLQQLQQAHPTVECVQAFSDQLPLQNESVDAIVCAQSFHWFSNIETLTEMHRVLKPSGTSRTGLESTRYSGGLGQGIGR